MLPEVNLTNARNLSPWFDRAVRDEQPVKIIRGRRRREKGLLIAQDLLERALSGARFHVDVVPEVEWPEGGFTLALRELPLSAYGATFWEARQALPRAVRAYVQDYFDQIGLFLHLPDKLHELPYVLRLSLAQEDQELNAILFAPGAAAPGFQGATATG